MRRNRKFGTKGKEGCQEDESLADEGCHTGSGKGAVFSSCTIVFLGMLRKAKVYSNTYLNVEKIIL